MYLIIFSSLFFLFLFYSIFVEPNRLTVKTYKINCPGLSGLKAVFVGDFHLKKTQIKKLRKITSVIKSLSPDIILSTGDFVFNHNFKNSLDMTIIADELSKIIPKYGFYTSLGNHDWLAGGDIITTILTKYGINVLTNGNTCFDYNGKKIYISGVGDVQTSYPDMKKALSETKQPVILLTHSPDIFPNLPSNVTLTLAGHTHGGQIRLPFMGALVIPSKYGEKFAKGIVKENDKSMIITQGIGTSILPLRLNCPPEIVVIEFINNT